MLSRPQTSHLTTLARTLMWRVCLRQLTHHLITGTSQKKQSGSQESILGH